jgi:hypothetical protein
MLIEISSKLICILMSESTHSSCPELTTLGADRKKYHTTTWEKTNTLTCIVLREIFYLFCLLARKARVALFTKIFADSHLNTIFARPICIFIAPQRNTVSLLKVIDVHCDDLWPLMEFMSLIMVVL